jgi:hypothetical protein
VTNRSTSANTERAHDADDNDDDNKDDDDDDGGGVVSPPSLLSLLPTDAGGVADIFDDASMGGDDDGDGDCGNGYDDDEMTDGDDAGVFDGMDEDGDGDGGVDYPSMCVRDVCPARAQQCVDVLRRFYVRGNPNVAPEKRHRRAPGPSVLS